MNIKSQSLNINGTAAPTLFTGIGSQAEAGSGNGGEINLMVNGPISVVGSGEISSATLVSGNAGDVSIKAQSVTINGTATPQEFTQISSDAILGSTGNAGLVDLTVKHALTITGAGKVTSSTAGSGNGGDLTIQAGSLSINGAADPDVFTGIFSDAKSSLGNSGQIHLTVLGATSLMDTGEISSDSTSPGNAGDITMQTQSLSIDGSGTPSVPTYISSNAHGTGNAGQVNLTVTDNLSLTGHGEIVSNTSNAGNAGNVSVQAGSLSINGVATPADFTGISSNANAGSGNGGLVHVSVGGDILLTEKGQISSSAAANSSGSAGRVDVTANGSITLVDAGQITSDTSGSKNAGAITVQAGSLSIIGNSSSNFTGISSSAETRSSGNAGIISVNVSGVASLSSGGEIESSTFGAGNAGEVTFDAGSLSIDGSTSSNITALASQADSGSVGSAGLVNVTVVSGIVLTNQGVISSSSAGPGNAGEVSVQAGSLSMSGEAQIESSAFEGSTGNAGLVNVAVNGNLAIFDSGQIISGTFSSGNAGEVTVHAGSLNITGNFSEALTGITSLANLGATGNAGVVNVLVDNTASISNEGEISSSTSGPGNAGQVHVAVNGNMVMTGGSQINSATFASGNAGEVTVQAGSLSIIGDSSVFALTGITSSTYGTTGNAGIIDVTVNGNLSVSNEGGIESSTFGSGNAGDVLVHAGSLTIASTPNAAFSTGISSQAFAGSTGNAGNISVIVDHGLSISGTGQPSNSTNVGGIIAGSSGPGQGGTVSVTAGTLSLDNYGTINAKTTGLGAGGDVLINAGNIVLNHGSTISAESALSHGGSISINSGDSLLLLNGSSIDTSAGTDGGNITITAPGTVYLLDSHITAAANGGSTTKGGNILIDPDFLVLDNSYISANDPLGHGGNVTIQASYVFNPDNSITATGATQGTVFTPPPDLDLANSLVVQHPELVQADKELRERCARSLNHEFSSFIVVGRGGIAAPPEELQPDFGTTGPGTSQ